MNSWVSYFARVERSRNKSASKPGKIPTLACDDWVNSRLTQVKFLRHRAVIYALFSGAAECRYKSAACHVPAK
jgi:hypothetical protein